MIDVKYSIFMIQQPKFPIIDNTTAAFEMLHLMRNRRKGRTGHMAVKLDISKVCDRVEWEFLQWIMMKIGLPEKMNKLGNGYGTNRIIFHTHQ